jgi:hypothetical protein
MITDSSGGFVDYYETIGDAIAAVDDGQTITLIADIELTGRLDIIQDYEIEFTIDLDGFEIDFGGNSMIIALCDVQIKGCEGFTDLYLIEVIGAAAEFHGYVETARGLWVDNAAVTVNGHVATTDSGTIAVRAINGSNVYVTDGIYGDEYDIAFSWNVNAVGIVIGTDPVSFGAGPDWVAYTDEDSANPSCIYVAVPDHSFELLNEDGKTVWFYSNINVALNVLQDGWTILMKEDTVSDIDLMIGNGKEFTINLSGYEMDFAGTTTNNSLMIFDGSDVTFLYSQGLKNLYQVSLHDAYFGGAPRAVFDGGLVITDNVVFVTDDAELIVYGDIISTATISNDGLWVLSGATAYVNGNVHASRTGIDARGGAAVTVTGNVSGDLLQAVRVYEGSQVTVFGDVGSASSAAVYASGMDPSGTTPASVATEVHVYGLITAISTGIVAEHGALVFAYSDVGSGSIGVTASNNAVVTVYGDAVSADNVGVSVASGAKVYVVGVIKGYNDSGSGNDIRFPASGAIIGVTTPGGTSVFGGYSWDEYNDGTSFVYHATGSYVFDVFGPDDFSAGFNDVYEALANVPEGGTIKMMENVTLTDPLEICNEKTFTFDLNGYTLKTHDGSSYEGILIEGSNVTFLNCLGLDIGYVFVDNIGGADPSTVEFDAGMTLKAGYLLAHNGSTVTVNGDVVSLVSYGVMAFGGSTLTVNGDVSASFDAVSASYGSKITINGNVTATGAGAGVNATGAGTEITVTGDVTSQNGNGAVATFGAKVTVNGGVKSAAGTGVHALDAGTIVKVTGTVEAGGQGVFAKYGASVEVGADITAGTNGIFAESTDTTVTVFGDVTSATADAIEARDGARVWADGDVTADAGRGVYAMDTGTEVYVSGDILSKSIGQSIYATTGAKVTAYGDVESETSLGVLATDANTMVNVFGDVIGAAQGIRATTGASVTLIYGGVESKTNMGIDADGKDTYVGVYGSVTAQTMGVQAMNGATISVNGSVTSQNGGAWANNSSAINVGTVTSGSTGVTAMNGSLVTVTGSVSALNTAIYAEGGVIAVYSGDVTSTNSKAIEAKSGSSVAVDGNASAKAAAVTAESGSYVYVGGNVLSEDIDGVLAKGTNTLVEIYGSVTTTATTSSAGVFAENGAEVTVAGDVHGYSDGARAHDEGTKITVGGNVSSGGMGVTVYDGAHILVYGNVHMIAGNSVFVVDGGIVEVVGGITCDNPSTPLIWFRDTVDDSKSYGVFTYTEPDEIVQYNGYLWNMYYLETGKGWESFVYVAAGEVVCTITVGDDISYYATLAAAISAVQNGQTIELTQNIVLTGDLVICNGKTFTIDLKDFEIDFAGRIMVISSGDVTFDGCEGFTGLTYIDIFADEEGSPPRAVFNGDMTWTAAYLYVYDGAEVTVNGDITAKGGIYAMDPGTTVTVNGDITSYYNGVYAADGATVRVTGDITATNYTGVYAERGAKVYVTGNIVSSDSEGIFADGEGTLVTVTGNVTAYLAAVNACGGAKVDVTGNVESATACGAYAEEGAEVTVDGNVKSVGNFAVYAYDDPDNSSPAISKITVTGSVTSVNNTAIYASCNVSVTITGNVTSKLDSITAVQGAVVTVTGSVTSSDGGAVDAQSGATVTIKGNVKAKTVAVCAETGATVTVTGSVESTTSYAVAAYEEGTTITINGNIKGAVVANTGAEVIVTGNITTDAFAVWAYDGATITINGNITNGAGGAIWSSAGSKVYINGVITSASGNELIIGDSEKGFKLGTDDPTSTGYEFGGYFWDVYTDTADTVQSFVYIASDLIPAKAPSITTQPAGKTVDADEEVTLTVAATSPDGGTLSYQWYRNTANNNTGGTLITGATSSSYSPDTSSSGTVYYYCVVTNTITAGSETTASDVAMVKVRSAGGGGMDTTTLIIIAVVAVIAIAGVGAYFFVLKKP